MNDGHDDDAHDDDAHDDDGDYDGDNDGVVMMRDA